MTETVREILKRRDNLNDDEIDELFEGFKDDLRCGEDPEEAIAYAFGLEPDYFFDNEVFDAIQEAMS